MLANFAKSLWRQMFGAENDKSGLLRSELRAALEGMLREPPGHPKTVDYEMVAQLRAASTSADYLVNHMLHARNLVHREALLDFALAECSVPGLMLEFGVYRGASLRSIARQTADTVHGFDAFEGLPEDWTYFQKRGRFSLEGEVPHFEEPNVRIHQGWFDTTVPRFLSQHAGPVRFAHIDCDIYSATRTVLECLMPRLVSGSILLFDEYLNYPGWQQHEFKAFQECVETAALRYRYLGFASSNCAVAVKIS